MPMKKSIAIAERLSAPVLWVIGLANLLFLASRVIGSFIQIWERTLERGGRFVLCNLSDDALQGLIVTRLDTRWPTYATRKEALAAISG